MNKLRKKHDEIAKLFLAEQDIAYEFLSRYLPSEVLAICDLSTINIEPGTYIEDNLKHQASDIVYKIDLYDKSQINSVYLYVLIENQSRPERLMPLRIIRYQLAIIQKHLNKNKHNKVKLPLVVPLVFYNGEDSPYPYPCNIHELFANKNLYKLAPLGTFNLIDLTIKADDEILQHGKLSILEVVTKHIRDRDFIKVVDLIIEALVIGYKEDISQSLINGIFSYLIYAKDKGEITYLLEQIEDKIPFYKGSAMSYAEELLQEGYQKGKQEAMSYAEELLQEGYQKGKQEAMSYAKEGYQKAKQEGYQKGKQEAMSYAKEGYQKAKQEGYQEGKQEAMSYAKEGYQKAKQEGYQKAKQEAKQQIQQEIAKNLLKSGIDTLIIAKATNLSTKEIEVINKNLY